MGWNPSAMVVVGVEIQKNELLKILKVGRKFECKCREAPDPKFRFCSNCGKSIEEISEYHPDFYPYHNKLGDYDTIMSSQEDSWDDSEDATVIIGFEVASPNLYDGVKSFVMPTQNQQSSLQSELKKLLGKDVLVQNFVFVR